MASGQKRVERRDEFVWFFHVRNVARMLEYDEFRTEE